MTALPPDYDSDPGRSRAAQVEWQDDVHAPVADRLVAADAWPVLDVGCGRGKLGAALQGRLPWIGIDASPRQLSDCPYRPLARADALHLPVRDGSVGAVTHLWTLYHFERPVDAIAEARRALRSGGLFAACTNSRDSDPELVPAGYPPTTFDAEDAAGIVGEVFDEVEVLRWDEPMAVLADRQAVLAFARSHLLTPDVADRVGTPVTLTKRGCLVWAIATERGRT